MGQAEKEIYQVILEWIEKNPEQSKSMISSLDKISNSAGIATEMLNTMTIAEEKRVGVLEKLNDQTVKQMENVTRSVMPFDALISASQEYDKQKEKSEKEAERQVAREEQREKASRDRMSRTLGWMGYRFTMMGRVISRWLTAPMTAATKGMQNLDATMLSMATSMGMSAMYGQDFSDTIGGAFETVFSSGMEFDAAKKTVDSMLAISGIEISDSVTNFMWDLSAVIESAGPEFAKGYADALDHLFDALLKGASLVETYPEFWGRFAGYLTAVAAGITALGTALFFVSPAMKVWALLTSAGAAGATIEGAAAAGAGTGVTSSLTGQAIGGAGTGLMTQLAGATGTALGAVGLFALLAGPLTALSERGPGTEGWYEDYIRRAQNIAQAQEYNENNYGGDITIENVQIGSDYDVDEFLRRLEEWQKYQQQGLPAPNAR